MMMAMIEGHPRGARQPAEHLGWGGGTLCQVRALLSVFVWKLWSLERSFYSSYSSCSPWFRSILILDEKSVVRHLASSSLPMDDLIDSARWRPSLSFRLVEVVVIFFSLTLDLLREAGPVVVGEQQVPQPIFVIAADPSWTVKWSFWTGLLKHLSFSE